MSTSAAKSHASQIRNENKHQFDRIHNLLTIFQSIFFLKFYFFYAHDTRKRNNIYIDIYIYIYI